ncbi:hypothetical protein MBOVJF4428_00577 [Mycoplasmopsis agalactiae]|uniref:MAG0770 family lipoprotein n=1 Tax=Mycoplasmopsis agalactiae TaxID=2110 RepID=UPI000C706220|nr:hypothetical protein [Mycoplasmopsis agalactiae]MCE6056878.1 hypothetical protein [Mycoplasmopsis agalactiae]MCE6078667.1 hypothetical protein [Mycoplasmopsis agalactiae]MCE6095052.1 hypothetical protein [Mycoplasmopsis agalactiae]MCE6114311.1 hypothetical protein [Mycoplasmopsis agalactiae]NLS34710.1 hypothetical protein [Mycoplasmopsis agalactiae]
MSKWKVRLTFLPISLASLSIISASCQGSFYRQKDVFETEFSKEMFEYYNQYKNIWEQITNFISNDSYKKYFLDNYSKIDHITKEWKNVIDQILPYMGTNKDGKQDHKLELGYKTGTDGKFELINNSINSELLFNELTDKPKNKEINIRTNIGYIAILNEEVNNIISDYVQDLRKNKSDSLFKSFYNEFDILPGWPLFKNLSEKERYRYQNLFLESLVKKYSGMQSEYSRKFFDSQKVNIDYKNIRGITPEGNTYHTHALVNLWYEWNKVILPEVDDSSNSNDKRVWKNNKIFETVEFFKNVYKPAQKVKNEHNSKLILRFSKIDESSNSQNQVKEFELENLFDKFVLALVDDKEKWNIKIYSSDLDYNDFAFVFKNLFQELIDISAKINFTIKNYKN